MPFDKTVTHRESGITFDIEHGEDVVMIKFPPDVTKDEGGRGFVTVTMSDLRELGKFLLSVVDETDAAIETEYEPLDLTVSYASTRDIDDIPF